LRWASHSNPVFAASCFSRRAAALNFQNTTSRDSIDRLLTLEGAHDVPCIRPTRLIPVKRCDNYSEYFWRFFGLAECPVVSDPFPPNTGDFRSFREHVANEVVENPFKVGDGARRQRCEENRLYNMVSKPSQNFKQFATQLLREMRMISFKPISSALRALT
jgi:hypothetical protein